MNPVRRQQTSQPDAMYRDLTHFAAVPQLSLSETAVVFAYREGLDSIPDRSSIGETEKRAKRKIAEVLASDPLILELIGGRK